MNRYLSRRIADTIRGFNYRFDSLSGKPNELIDAFTEIFNPTMRITAMMILRDVFPFLNIIVSTCSVA